MYEQFEPAWSRLAMYEQFEPDFTSKIWLVVTIKAHGIKK